MQATKGLGIGVWKVFDFGLPQGFGLGLESLGGKG